MHTLLTLAIPRPPEIVPETNKIPAKISHSRDPRNENTNSRRKHSTFRQTLHQYAAQTLRKDQNALLLPIRNTNHTCNKKQQVREIGPRNTDKTQPETHSQQSFAKSAIVLIQNIGQTNQNNAQQVFGLPIKRLYKPAFGNARLTHTFNTDVASIALLAHDKSPQACKLPTRRIASVLPTYLPTPTSQNIANRFSSRITNAGRTISSITLPPGVPPSTVRQKTKMKIKIPVSRGTKIFLQTLTILYNFTRCKESMGLFKHITTIVLIGILSSVIPFGSVYAQSYDRSRLTHLDHTFTVGFERQVYSIYAPEKVAISKKTKAAEEHCNRIILRMKLTSRFKLETGLSYKAIDRILKNNGSYGKCHNTNEACKLTVPLTIQYNLLNEKCRLRPYFGTGVQYLNNQTVGSSNSEADVINNPVLSNRLKYFNIIFTEGLIYDVTPDLQITQSIHILPENGIKPIGINFGIGYRIK